MNKKTLWAAVLIVTVVSTVTFVTFLPSYADPGFLLRPTGRIRVALRSYGGGTATWFPTEPRVYDGSFSARLYTGTTAGADGGGIMIGPLGWTLSTFTDSRITFWAYHYNDAGGYDLIHQPYINIVLDNGRVMEGLTSRPVSPTATVTSEATQGFPFADLWVQMMPYGGWYTSFPADPVHVAAGTSVCTLTHTCTMAFWQHAFPTARVIQIEIVYGIWDATGLVIYIDNVSLLGVAVPIEPETIAA